MANKLRDLRKRKQKPHNKNTDGEEIPTCGVWIPSKKRTEYMGKYGKQK